MNEHELSIRALEESVHRIASLTRRCLILAKRAKRRSSARSKLLERLYELREGSRDLEERLSQVLKLIETRVLDEDQGERVHLLSFFVAEVIVNEEREIIKRVEMLGLDSVIELSDVERLRRLANEILARTSLR